MKLTAFASEVRIGSVQFRAVSPRRRHLSIQWLRLPLLLVLSLSLGAASKAQTGGTGNIYGSVSDPSNAKVPGAVVVAQNRDTGFERRVTTTSAGDYAIANLPVGTYSVTITKPGFRTFFQEGVILQVDGNARVDAVLQVGSTAQRVIVNAEAPLIETTNATLSTVVDERRMADLPLNGRNPLQLMMLVPGVQPTSGAYINQAFTNPNQQFVSASGARGNGVVFDLDGGDNSDNYTNVANVYPNPDALREFSFQTDDYSVEYGGRGGGVVNAATRSGTNDFHGTAFEYIRNYDLNATNFFTPGVPDGLKRNQYGATFGGPIRKDKSFFFVAWQGTNTSQVPHTASTVVPTEAMRNGDFSGLRTSSGLPVSIKDPTTGLLFANDQIPVSRFDPIALKFLSYIPTPTSPTGLLNYATSTRTADDQAIARLDHRLTVSDHLTGRLVYDSLRQGNTLLPGTLLGASYTPNFKSINLLISDTHTFSPSLLGVFSSTFNRLWSGYTYGYPTTLSDLGANIYNMSPNKSISLGVSGFFGVGDVGEAVLVRNNFEYKAAMTYMFGRNELKFGSDILRQQFNIPSAAYLSDGSFSFSNSFSGSNLTDFFLGLPSSYTQNTPWAEALRDTVPGFYLEDNLKLTSRLALDIGMRWQPLIPWIDVRNDETTLWRVGAQSQRAPGLPPDMLVAGDPGVPQGGYNGSLSKFDPRGGLAYLLPDGKTSVRLGYGIFHESANAIINNRIADGAPFTVSANLQNPPSIVDPWTTSAPNPFPTVLPPPASYKFPLPVLGNAYNNGFTNSYTQQWNFTIEHQFTPNWLLRSSYVGSEGDKLLVQEEINPALITPGASLSNVNQRRLYAPDWTYVQELCSCGNSTYQSVAISLEKRWGYGLSILAGYTLSKSIDEQSAVVSTGGSSATDPYNLRYDRGLSDFDHTNVFVASYIWALPSPKGINSLVRLLGAGWQTNGIVTLESGTPFSVYDGSNRSLNGTGADDRANVLANPELSSSSRGQEVLQYFNTQAFGLSPLGTYGTSGRNILRGPGYADVDFSLFKAFRINESKQLQFRIEAFNLFNRVNLNNPTTIVTSPVFGRITSAGSPRILQLALRFQF